MIPSNLSRCWLRIPRLLWWLGWFALILLIAGCGAGKLAPVDSRGGFGPAPPGYYRVRSGDTLSEIAERKRLAMRKLAAWNDLKSPYPIYAGSLLRVKPPAAGTAARPGGSRAQARRGGTSSRAAAKPVKTSARKSAVVAGSDGARSGIRWQWPLKGPVKQGFRAGDRTRSGIRIGAPPGTPVASAADGTVVYSGSGLKGYGNLIIVKHSKRYLSAYGYNRQLLVREGERVKRGQRLAEVGQAANGENLLHFEIRKDGVAVDPIRFLPASR
ncbi:MAG: peptidoglycan DD-metalloendopeptidase family protein [Thiohalocapsa sp. PB-PSB1]|jgi:lipoprotein NlpD|nr:MAG: peptidoglycan DD-metalloendopeptidase family protein [Thiohalocapsa sp. PB-PSB1]HCS89961.1 peptidase M23 [Chromatiaceae bacterium]